MADSSSNGHSHDKGQEFLTMTVASDCVPVKEPEEAEDYVDERESSNRNSWRNLAAFWIIGLCNNYGYVVMLSAAHDILSRFDPNKNPAGHGNSTIPADKRDCNYMSTGAILLADIVPSLIIKTVFAFMPLWIHGRMVVILLLACSGFILVGSAETQWVALLGVVATAFSSGLGECTLLAYMPYFKNKNVISAWSSGTGGAGFFGSISYAGLTSLGLTPSMTLYIMLVVPVAMGLSFWLLLERPSLEHPSPLQTDVLPSYSSDRLPLHLNNHSFIDKLRLIPSLLKYMIPLGLVYFFEYFINQGLFELVYFENSFLSHAEQYRWYQVDYQIGVFISRSSSSLIQINAIWILALLQGLNVVLFTLEAFYAFLPGLLVVLAAVWWEGLLGGAAYVNTYNRINTQELPERREFAMAITALSDAIGISLAGFLAMPAHNYICSLPKHL